MKAKKIVSSALCVMLGASVAMTGCGKMDKDATLITINDGEDTISLGYANFVARYQQSIYDQYLMSYYGETMWSSDLSGSGENLQDETKDGVLDDLEEQYLAKKHAADYDVTLSDDDNTAIADAVAQFFDDNPEETLEVMGATEEYLTQMLEDRTYQTRVKEAVRNACTTEISDDECWEVTITYAYFNTVGTTDSDGNTTTPTQDEINDMKVSATALSTAEDFDTTCTDLGVEGQSYSFLKNEDSDSTLDMSVIEAALKLNDGEVSDVIEVEDAGYYVVRMDSTHDEEASESERETLLDEAKDTFYDDTLTSWKDEITWEVDDKQWEKVQFDTLFKTLESEEESTEETTEESTEATTEETTDDSTEAVEDTTAEETESEDASEEETTEDTQETEEDTTEATEQN